MAEGTKSSSTTGRWVLDPNQAGLSSLRYEPTAEDKVENLGPEDVLVEMHAASLNYRDIVIAKGQIPGVQNSAVTPSVVPGSDGAGIVVAVGSAVSRRRSPWLQVGARVVTHMIPLAPADSPNTDALPCLDEICNGLGQRLNGTLCRRGTFHHTCLVPMPRAMTFEEAATLTCSGLTAWNALFGAPGREVKPGDWVLVQGTGGVSVAALQIAVAVGANVIAITSSEARAERLSALGASHVINYKEQPNWGDIAKSFTPDQRGVDHIVDVVGPKTLSQALASLRYHGLITIAGMLGGTAGDEKTADPGMMSALWKHSTYRGIILGSQKMFFDMIKFMEEKDIKPAVDDVAFPLEEAKKAFERLENWEHFSKVVIKIQT